MDFFWHIIALAAMDIPAFLGLNLVFGKGKILHFGPMGIALVAAYAVVIPLIATQSFLIAIISGIIATAIICALFAWLSLRLEADAFGVMAIAVHLMILAVALNWTSLTRGALGIPQVPRLPFLNSPFDFAICSSIVAGIFAFVLWRLDKSTFGRQLNALAEHEWHAKSLGINRAMIHFLAFAINGIGALITVFFFRQYLTLLHPNDFGFPVLIFMVMVVVAGKPGSVPGVVLATFVFHFLHQGLRFLSLPAEILGPMRLILFGLILFGAVWWRRDTLFPQERRI